MQYGVFTIFVLFLAYARAQDTKTLQGKIYNHNEDVSGVSVINSSSQMGTVTDRYGTFSIPVQIGDTLIIRAVQFITEQVVISPPLFNNLYYETYLTPEVTDLGEIQISDQKLTGSLAKDSKEQQIQQDSVPGFENSPKPLSSEERRFHTATTRPADQVGRKNLRFDISLDRIINAISGKTKRLKRHLAISEQTALVNQVRAYYSEDVFNNFGVESAYINDFLSWSLESPQVRDSIIHRDRMEILEFLIRRKDEYLSLKDRESKPD